MITAVIILGILVILLSVYIFFINIGILDDTYELSDDTKNKIKSEIDRTKDNANLKSKVTKSQLRSIRKDDLIILANDRFDIEFSESLSKTNLINKIYELYNK